MFNSTAMQTGLELHTSEGLFRLTAYGLLASVLAVILHNAQSKRPKGTTALPGPYPLPLVGNWFQLPKQPLFLTVAEWSKRYGDCWTFIMGTRRFVVLSTVEAVKTCYVEKGATFSSRDASNKAVYEIIARKGDGNVSFAVYGQTWRDARKAAHVGLTKIKVDQYWPIIEETSRSLLYHLDKVTKEHGDAGFFPKHLFHFFGLSTIMSILVDARGITPEAEILKQVDQSVNGFFRFIALETAPITTIPGAKFFLKNREKEAYALREWRETLYQGIVDDFKRRKELGQTRDCMVGTWLDKREETGMTDIQLLGLFSGMIGGGYETVALSLSWNVIFLIKYPEYQQKIFEEMDAVLKGERLPDGSDEIDLPKTRSFIYETLRLRNPVAFAVPHVTSQDETYKGQFIPAGTTVIVDMYNIGRDPEVFAEPEKFVYDRHEAQFAAEKYSKLQEGQTGAGNESVVRRMNAEHPFWAFGAGRRVCVGMHLGDRELFVAFARLVYCFKVEAGLDSNGRPIPIDDTKMKVNFNVAPAEYKARFVPRWPAEKMKKFIEGI